MIFLDTSLILAWHNQDDKHHKEACDILEQRCDDHKFISDYVFDECVTFIKSRANAKSAQVLGNALLAGDVAMIKVGDDSFQRAWSLFTKYNSLSFTDCTILAVMEQFHIKQLATFDSGFNQVKGINVVDR